MFGHLSSCHNWGEICSWHLVGRGLGCCFTSPNVQDSPPRPRITQLRASRVPKWRNHLGKRSPKTYRCCSIFKKVGPWTNKRKSWFLPFWFKYYSKATGFLVFLIKLQISQQEFWKTTIFAYVVKQHNSLGQIFFSFTFHDTSNYLMDGYKNELKNLSKAPFLKNTRRDGRVTLVCCGSRTVREDFPFLLLLVKHHTVCTYTT